MAAGLTVLMSALAAGSGEEGNLGHGRLAALNSTSALGISVVFDIAWPFEHVGRAGLASGAAVRDLNPAAYTFFQDLRRGHNRGPERPGRQAAEPGAAIAKRFKEATCDGAAALGELHCHVCRRSGVKYCWVGPLRLCLACVKDPSARQHRPPVYRECGAEGCAGCKLPEEQPQQPEQPPPPPQQQQQRPQQQKRKNTYTSSKAAAANKKRKEAAAAAWA